MSEATGPGCGHRCMEGRHCGGCGCAGCGYPTPDPRAPVHWAGRTFGQLSPGEQQSACRIAGHALTAELLANADALSAIMTQGLDTLEQEQ